MTAPLDDALLPAGEDRVPGARAPRRRTSSAIGEVCPFLRSRDGAWSSAYAARDHRCWAVRPPAQPAIAKQRELCLVAAHRACATFTAAIAADAGVHGERKTGAGPEVVAGLWPSTRAVPLVLEPVRGRAGIVVAPTRSGGQALLVGLMVLAFLVLVIARTASPSASEGPPSATPAASQPAAVASASAASSASPSAESTGSPSPASMAPSPTAPRPSPTPRASASPSGPRSYTVRSGDTLGTIAARFGTTVKAIAAANGITNTRLIHPGQVLIIP